MKRIFLAALVAVAGLAMIAPDAEARRFGGGGSAGFQRSVPTRTAPQTPPKAPANNQATQGTQSPAAGAPATPRRSWMAPLAGLAAGLGLAALMSHLGLGAEFANFIMMALLILAAVVVVRLLMRRFGPASAQKATLQRQGMQFAGAGQPHAAPSYGSGAAAPSRMVQPAQPAPSSLPLPADFDVAAFERVAKLIFIRMQAANDAGDLDDLRRFTTPEMFASARLDLQERNGTPQRTDVVQLDAEVLDVAQEPAQQIVSVRYHGLIREEQDGAAAPFDEIWHLVRPADGSREWAIAGIAQTSDA